MHPNVAWRTAAIALTWMVLLAACQTSEGGTPTPSRTSSEPPSLHRTITLGDVEPDEPIKKIRRIQPLTDYLAEHLNELGIESGRVVLSRDFEEMAGLLSDGTVDIYFDSPFPTLTVQELSGSTVIARRWKEGDPIYWSLYIARRDSGITGLDGFLGKVVAFEKTHSTSGFILPAGTLIQRGFTSGRSANPTKMWLTMRSATSSPGTRRTPWRCSCRGFWREAASRTRTTKDCLRKSSSGLSPSVALLPFPGSLSRSDLALILNW